MFIDRCSYTGGFYTWSSNQESNSIVILEELLIKILQAFHKYDIEKVEYVLVYEQISELKFNDAIFFLSTNRYRDIKYQYIPIQYTYYIYTISTTVTHKIKS